MNIIGDTFERRWLELPYPDSVHHSNASGSFERTPGGWSIMLSPETAATQRAAALNELCDLIAIAGGGRAEFWVEAATDVDNQGPLEAGFSAYRDLFQMRADLPVSAAVVKTRAFQIGDEDAFLAVNNRAFSWHPEQSGLTRQDLAARQAEPWYDAEGFRILERDGNIAGFCWTKIHADEEPPLGEIYVIGVDPPHHGQGLGLPLTAAGLQWLHQQGLTKGILYVESDNHAAVQTYKKLGFEVFQTNRAFERTIEPKPDTQ